MATLREEGQAGQAVDNGSAAKPDPNLGASPILFGPNHAAAGHVPPSRTAPTRHASAVSYDIPEQYTALDELAGASPVPNSDGDPISHLRTLEQQRTAEQEHEKDVRARQQHTGTRSQAARDGPERSTQEQDKVSFDVSRLATQLYTLSYLVLFSLLGTLARLGLQALTTYPGTPLLFASAWPNFAGSLVMGFLAEDRVLFRRSDSASSPDTDPEAAKTAHMAAKKTTPLYIGLATGFCGSLTSFSAFMRDLFLALSNNLAPPPGGISDSPPARSPGYSVPAVLGVLLTTLSLSLPALFLGAHLAIAFEPWTPSLTRHPALLRVLDRLVVPLALGCWVGAVVLSAVPPNGSWRGIATFALVFAPLGCLLRFYLSLRLNRRAARFPLGTFAANVLGTAVLGMAWDLAHAPVAGVVGCQVLQGIQDGFCGCLTTVSTWVAELAALRRRNAYVYGGVSVVVGWGVLIAVMGGLAWSEGFDEIVCVVK